MKTRKPGQAPFGGGAKWFLRAFNPFRVLGHTALNTCHGPHEAMCMLRQLFFVSPTCFGRDRPNSGVGEGGGC